MFRLILIDRSTSALIYACFRVNKSLEGFSENRVWYKEGPAATSAMPYAVCKAGINHMTKLSAKELGPEIRVNAIAPRLWLSA